MRAGVNLAALFVLAWRAPLSLLGDRRPALWSRGVLGAASLLTYFVGLSYLGVGEAAFLNQTSAIWVALLAPFVLGERTPPTVWIAVLGSLLGVGLLAHPRDEPGDLLGRTAALSSGLFAAGAYLSIRRASRSNGALTIVFYFTLIATVISLALAFVSGTAWPTDPLVYALLAGSGVAATGGQLLMTEAYRVGRAGPVAAAGAFSPLATTVFGWVLLAQVPDARAMAGMAVLVVTSVLLPMLAER